jgi:hypothetical protein
MKIVNIFAVIDDSLLAVQFEGKHSDEFAELFSNWQDVEFLEDFFENNKKDLQSGFFGTVSVDDAVFRTMEEADELETFIKEVSVNGKSNPYNTLYDLVFHQLHENDFSKTHLSSKAYGSSNKTWLRVYAIRIADNLYVVTGGAIKLTKSMQEREHTEIELKKLKIVSAHLKEIGFDHSDDYGFIDIESYGIKK